jgi:hypothetical protein
MGIKLEPSATFYPISSTDIERYDVCSPLCPSVQTLDGILLQMRFHLKQKDNFKLDIHILYYSSFVSFGLLI